MGTKTTASAPWQELETQAYHAYREWPLWLVLRERELADRLAVRRTAQRATGAAGAAASVESQPMEKETKA